MTAVIQSLKAKEVFNPHAQNTIATLLESEPVSDAWQRHHYSRRKDNTPLNLASQIREIGENINEYPELLAFMQNLVSIERSALGKPEKNEPDKRTKLRSQLEHLEKYLSRLSQVHIPEESLPEDHRIVLNMLRHETGQIPFRPLHSLWKSSKKTAHHIVQDAKEHPAAFGTLLATSLGLLHFMNLRMGVKSSYIDPKLLQITDLDVDALFDSNAPLTISTEAISETRLGCHDHLAQLLGNSAADFIKDKLDAVNLFPQHCSRVKTLALNAQHNLQSSYDFLNSRLELIIRDPTKDLAEKIFPDSPFRDAFYNAANHTAEFIYAANTVENVVLHTIIFTSAAIGTVKLGTIAKEEFSEAKNNLQDFLVRSTTKTPLNYLLCASGSTFAYLANGSLNPEMLWMGMGGLLVGQTIHNTVRRHNAPEFIKQSTLSISKELAEISDASKILGDETAGTALTPNPTLWEKLKIPALTTGAITITGAIDLAATQGQITGSLLGGLGVITPFIFYNIPEDAALHTIFVAAGGIFGMTWLGIGKAGKKMLQWVKHNDENNSSPKPD